MTSFYRLLRTRARRRQFCFVARTFFFFLILPIAKDALRPVCCTPTILPLHPVVLADIVSQAAQNRGNRQPVLFQHEHFLLFFFFLLSRKTLYEHNIPGVFFSLSVFLRFPCHVAYKVTSFRRLRRTAARSSQFCFVCFLFVLTPFFVVAVFPFFLLGCLLSFDPIIYRLPRIGGRRNNQSRPLAGKEG